MSYLASLNWSKIDWKWIIMYTLLNDVWIHHVDLCSMWWWKNKEINMLILCLLEKFNVWHDDVEEG